jgi:hypothetical protein
VASIGLFSRVDLQTAIKKKAHVKQRAIDKRAASELSHDAANALIKNQVQPYVQDDASFLVVGRQADSTDVPLTGKIHQVCYELDCCNIPYALDALLRSKSVPKVRSDVLAAAMAQNVRDTVLKIRPRVVLALSPDVAQALLPGLSGSVVDMRGQAYPAHVGDHDFWLVVTHDPRDIKEDDYGRPPIWAGAILQDTKLAVSKWQAKKPPDTTYMRAKRSDMRAWGAYEKRKDHRVEALRRFAKTAKKKICLDYETSLTSGTEARKASKKSRILPWQGDHARITAISFSDGDQTISVPFDHKLFIGADDRSDLIEAFKDCLRDRIVIAHNVLFELYWTFWVFGKDVVFLPKRWECTQVGAFVNFVRVASAVSDEDDEPGVAGPRSATRLCCTLVST